MLVLVLSLAVAVLLIAIGMPLALGRVRPNHWYGFRVGRALEDERAWYAANRASGRWLALAGAALALAAVLNALLGVNSAVAALVNGVVLALGVIVAMAAGFAAMNHDDFPPTPSS